MFKKFVFIFLLTNIVGLMYASYVFPIDFNLDGHIPFRNNSPDYLKVRSGLSISDDRVYIFDLLYPKIDYHIDVENGMIRVLLKHGSNQISNPIYISFDDYLDNLFEAVFDREFGKVKIQSLRVRNRIDQQGLIPEIVFNLPVEALPRTVRRIIGSEAGRLNLSGTQRVTISASRTHRKTNLATEYGGNTNFDVTMRQDLSLNLRGTIGEKISVNVRYHSGQESNIFDPNNISIKYTGDEDEIVQSIEAGNISLSLSGSRSISHSASSQGLFGVRSEFKLGDLTIIAVASKEESQKNVRTFKGTSQPDSSFVRSREFAKRKMYYVADPTTFLALYKETDNVPASWVNNAIKIDSDTRNWVLQQHYENVLPDPRTLKVYQGYLGEQTLSHPGKLVRTDGSPFDPEDAERTYHFIQLFEGADYFYHESRGYIILNNPVLTSATLAIAFTTLNGAQVGEASADMDEYKLVPIRIQNQKPEDETWIYELRNTYDLGMRNVRSDGFSLEAFTYLSDETRNYYVPEGTTGADGWSIIQYLQLDTNRDNIIDGEDFTIDLTNGRIELPLINPFFGLRDTLMYMQDHNVNDDYFNNWFFIRGRIGRDSINLGMMILPGSVKIRVNNKELKETLEYIVDYDLGTVTFLTAEGRDPDSDIQIDYENRPLFAIESKTLLGFRADWKPTDIFRLGGTFIYHAETMTDKRPRVGNEGRTLILANIDGEIAVDAPYITTAIDYIPLINTDENSRLSLTGDVAMSIPRLKGSNSFGDGNEAWIDDMESITEVFPLGIMRPTWSPASEPFGTNLVKGRVNWFNPTNVYFRDVYPPNTMSEKDRVEKIAVLDIKVIPPKIYTPGVSTPVWGGVMKYVGNELDFSEREYIEFLVKVDSVSVNFNQVKMYIDLGDVSEDFYTENGGRGILNTEDGIVSGRKTGTLHAVDDIGLSGIPVGQPGFDPFDIFSEKEINGEFPFINGTARNGVLDTEDLNGNGVLDTLERMFRYQVTLGDTLTSFFQNEYNGWHLYRIPLYNNPFMEQISSVASQPDLKRISFVRMWFETETLAKVRLVYVDIVGNKWRELPIRTRDEFTETLVPENSLNVNNTFISVETIDNQKSSRYIAPPKTTERGRDGNISYEQSLMVHYHNIQPGQISLSRQRFRESFNLLGYNKLRYWVYLESHPDIAAPVDTLNIILRLGVDLNQQPQSRQSYYEILKPVKVNKHESRLDISNWYEIEVDFKDLTRLKTFFAESDTSGIIDNIHYKIIDENVTYHYDGDDTIYRIYGNPTLSNIRDLAIGIEAPNNEMPFTGTVYFNDIRVAEPNQNIGYIANVTFDAKFADFSTFRVTYEWKTADFTNTTTRSTGVSSNLDDRVRLNVSNGYSLNKFFPVSWGLRFPLNLTYDHSEGIPRYKTNSDILREILSDEEKEREKNINYSRSAQSSISMTRTPNNKILAYTLRNMTIGGDIKETHTLSATRADSTVTWRINGSYNLSLPQESLRLKLFNNYFWNFIPKTYNNSANLRGETPRRWNWDIKENGWALPVQSNKNIRVLETSNDIRYEMLSDMNLNYRLNTKRNLLHENFLSGINIGTEEERTQNFEHIYNPVYMTRISPLQIKTDISYRENRRAKSTSSVDEEIFQYDGNVNRAITFNLTLQNSNWFTSIANKLGESANRKFQANTRESGQGFDDLNEDDKNGINGNIDNFITSGFDRDDFFDNNWDDHRNTRRYQNDDFEDNDVLDPTEDENDTPPSGSQPNEKEQRPNTIIADFFGILGRVQNFNLNYQNSYGSRFEQKDERPAFLYQLGLPNIIKDEDLNQRQLNDNFSASTGFPIIRNLVSDWRYSYQIQRTYTNIGRGAMNTTTTWPDVRMTLSGFERIIRAEKLLNSSRLTSNYHYTERLTYQSLDWTTPQTGQHTHSFTPLLGWTGNWVNDLTSTFNVSLTMSENNTYGTAPTINETTKIVYTGSLGYSFSAEQGIKIPFTGRTINIRNQLQSDISVNYETENSSTITHDGEVIPVREQDRLVITPRASYNFHRNMRGGLQGSYDIMKNKIRDESTNIFKLDIWIEVLF